MAGLDVDFDPMRGFDSAMNLSGSGRSGAQPRPAYRQPLDTEGFASVGQKALKAGASGLSYALGTLDKPGQAVRGLLAGKGASSLKHLVPFADTAGLVNEGDYTSGRDLTDKVGITSKYDKGWGAWGAGLGASIATDPLSYMTFGAGSALTGMGKAVAKTGALKGWGGRAMLEGFHGTEPALLQTGHTASDLAHSVDAGQRIAQGAAAATGVQAGQPLSSLVRIGVPFGGPSVNLGTGKVAQKIAGGLDAAGDYLKYGNPVGRAVGSMFDSARHGAVDKITQKGAAKYMEPALQTLRHQARDDRFGVIHQLDPIVSANAFPEQAVNDAARAVAEGVPHPYDPALASQVQPVAAHVNQINARMLAEARAAGAPARDVGDAYANYVHRSAFPESPQALQMGGQGGGPRGLLPVSHGAAVARDELFRDIPGGTGRINDWFDRFAGIKQQIPTVTKAIKKDMVQDLQAGGGQINQALGKSFDDKAAALAERLANSREIHRTLPDRPGQPLFSPDLVADVTQRGNQHAKSVANTQTAIGILGDVAQRMVPGSDQIPIHTVLKKLGISTTKADPAAGTAMEGGLVQAYRALAKQGAGKVDPFLNGKRGALQQAVNQWGISPEHFDQLTKAYGKWAAPEQIKSSVGAFDSITNAFKSLAYPIWLPSHVRNASTAAVNNARQGVGLRDYIDQLKAMTGRGARDLSDIHPSLAGLAPADQVDALRRLQYGAGNIFGGNGMNEEIAGNVRDAFVNGQRFTPQIPGSDRVGVHGNIAADTADLALKQGLLGSVGATGKAAVGSVAGLANPNRSWGQSIAENLGIRGVGGAAKDSLPAVAAGRKIGTNVEDFFRGALFNKLSRSGYSPAMAADEINKLHFDYGALTDFEKNVMRRAVPFYTYMRKNLPLQIHTALHNPGIIQAQSKPFMQDQHGYTPKYMDSGFAIPIGEENNGNQQYVSKLGLPAEEAFEKLHFKDGLPDIRRTALSYAGGLNPVIKAPLEQLFDTQFHTQRKLSDLKAPAAASAIGRLFGDDNPQLLSQVMSNSPLTRFVSSADKLMDPRKSLAQKAMNLATGVKVTDVDVDKQRAIDTRSALEEMMAGHPNLSRYSSFYVKPGEAQNLTPEEIELMRAYSTQQAQARAYAAQQRERIGVR